MKSIVLLLFVFSISASAKGLGDLKQVTNQFDCFSGHFDSYDSWIAMLRRNPNFKLDRFPFKQEEFDRYKRDLTCTIFDYLVDDVIVQGFLIHPKNAAKSPTIIYNRGGNGSFGRVFMGSMMNDLMPLASQGFVVIGSQYRWSRQKGKAEDFVVDGKSDEFGGVDQLDVAALLPIIASLSAADPSRVGVYGVSRGGMQSYLFAKAHHHIKAMVVKAGISDLFHFRDRSDKTQTLLSTRIPGYAKDPEAELTKRSALHWPEKLPEVPILLVHAKDDERVDYDNSVQMTKALEQLERPVKFLSLEDGGHSLTKHKEVIDTEIVDWFLSYL